MRCPESTNRGSQGLGAGSEGIRLSEYIVSIWDDETVIGGADRARETSTSALKGRSRGQSQRKSEI